MAEPTEICGRKMPENFTNGKNSLGEFVMDKLTIGGDKVLLINGKTEQEITANQIKEKSVLVARCLYKFGIRKYDKVGIVCDNRFDFLAIAYGAIFLGATPVLINISYKELEMEHAFSLVHPKLVFTSNYAAKQVVAVAPKFQTSIIFLDDLESENSFQKFLENPTDDDFMAKDINIYEDVCLILYSSGTTGLPKGVELTHANMMYSLGHAMEIKSDFFKRHSDIDSVVFLNIAPWFHVMGFIVTYLVICEPDMKLVFLPRFEEEIYLKAIQTYKVNLPVTVPQLLLFLAKSPRVAQYDLSSIKEVICGAAPVTPELEATVKARFENLIILQVYGMTESCGLLLYQKKVDKPGSITLLPGLKGKVVDAEGNTLGANQKGELCFKGKNIMKGYIGNEKATHETIDEKGWIHTGDVGYYDDDHQFYIVERLKELIKYNAFQVPPAEIEGILLLNPKIREAGVFGIPDEKTGEKAVAYVVKQTGVEVTAQEIIDFVAEKASKPKQLHGGVYFVDQLPKNDTGKVMRRILKEWWQKQNS